MESYCARNLSFTYPGRERPALDGINLTIVPGEFITLAGASGCGKTTLLRHCKPVLAPHGSRSGTLSFEGAPIETLTHRTQSARIGFLSQHPDRQIVTDKVWHELAFGLESLGLDTPSIRLRVAEMAAFFGIEGWFHRDVSSLSGGQKQLLNLASLMVMHPSVLLLDEPTGQLDPIAASDFLAALGRLNRELGVTVLLSEHRLDEALPLSDRLVLMESGRILCDEAPRQAGASLRTRGHEMFLAMPAPVRIWAATGSDGPCPLTVREGRAWLSGRTSPQQASPGAQMPLRGGKPTLALSDLWFRYEKDAPDVLRGLSLSAYPGEITALLGGNGSGKTTVLSLMAGLLSPQRGTVRRSGEALRVGLLPQNPQALFTESTLRADLFTLLAGQSLSPVEAEARLCAVSALCHLDTLLHCHPYDLSGGEQQRAALAKVLLRRPDILMLDEPTQGLDAAFKAELGRILQRLAEDGVTIVLVSHDPEFCAEYAHRCALFFDGAIVAEGAPSAFFSGNSFYTTAANRMARDLLPQAVTVDDVVLALEGRPPLPPSDAPKSPSCGDSPSAHGSASSPDHPAPPRETSKPSSGAPASSRESSAPPPGSPAGRRLSLRTVAALLLLLLGVPCTIYVGMRFFGDRRYALISLLILLEAMLPFFLAFEGRKPRARELVLLSVLCGIGVAGRAAFFMLPQCKPVAALVILTGVSLGAEAGFLVGAMTTLVGNIFFGQGPWTPWQMFSFGLLGLVAALFRRKTQSPSPVSLAILGGLSVFFLYGGLMNPASVLMFQPKPTWEMFALAYLRGIPFDLIHAAATALFLLLISRPILEKLERVKVKYELLAPRNAPHE